MIGSLQVLAQLGMYIITVTVGLVIHGFVLLPLMYSIITRKNPFTYMKGMLQVSTNRAFNASYIT